MRLHVPDHVHHRENADGGVVVLNARTGRWHALNATAGRLWLGWRQGIGFEAGVVSIARSLPDTPAERIRADAGLLLQDLVTRGLVEVRLGNRTAAVMAQAPPERLVASCRADRLYAAVCLPLAVLLLRLPFRATCTVVTGVRRLRPQRTPGPARSASVVAAVELAARRHPGRAACLERSLAAVLVAAASGHRLDWCLGALPDPYRFHSWVEAEGRPVGADAPQYLRVLTV